MRICLSYIFVALTIVLTVYGQLVLKWKMGDLAPEGLRLDDLPALIRILLNPWVITAFVAAFAASLCWMAAISKLPLSKAYPFMAMSFPTVAILAVLFFNEQVSTPKVVGILLIVLGAIVLSRAPG